MYRGDGTHIRDDENEEGNWERKAFNNKYLKYWAFIIWGKNTFFELVFSIKIYKDCSFSVQGGEGLNWKNGEVRLMFWSSRCLLYK